MLTNIACTCLANRERGSVKKKRAMKVKMVVLKEAEQEENIMKT
jgi:hypothetical protein